MTEYPEGTVGELIDRLGEQETITFLVAQSIELRTALVQARDALIDATCIVPPHHFDYPGIELALHTVRQALGEP